MLFGGAPLNNMLALADGDTPACCTPLPRTLIGSRSVSGGISTDAAAFNVASFAFPFAEGSGELSLCASGFRVLVFFCVAAGALLEVARVARVVVVVGAAAVFVRVEVRVEGALALDARVNEWRVGGRG